MGMLTGYLIWVTTELRSQKGHSGITQISKSKKATLIPRTGKTEGENGMIRIQSWLNLKGDRTTAEAASGAREKKLYPLQKNLPK